MRSSSFRASMTPMDRQNKRPPMAAREWLVVIGAGVVIAVLGQPAVGLLIGVLGVGGLAWRLVGDR